MTRLRDNRGFTLVELLLAMTLMLMVMGATLNALEHFMKSNQRNQALTQDTDRARGALDLMARDIRNATGFATTANTSSAAVLRATATDFVFKAVGPQATRTAANAYGIRTVRYCVVPSQGRIVRQFRNDVVTPAAGCPDASFTTTATIANVVNGTRPLFRYDSATPGDVTRAEVSLFVDGTPNRAPAETALHSGLYLRNVNRRPTAAFTALPAAGRRVQLNASTSTDPDGDLLTYTWKDGATTLTDSGPTIDYVAPTAGSHTFTLTVTDGTGLNATATRTVTVLS